MNKIKKLLSEAYREFPWLKKLVLVMLFFYGGSIFAVMGFIELKQYQFVNTERAKRAVEQLTYHPNIPEAAREAHYKLGGIYYRGKDYAGAISEWEHIANPNNVSLENRPDLYLELAMAYIKAGQPEKALEVYNNLRELDPKNLPSLLGQARCQEFTSPDQAQALFQQVLQLNPQNKEAIAGLARIFTRRSEQLADAADPEFLAKRKEYLARTDSYYRMVISDTLQNADILYDYGVFLLSRRVPDSLQKSMKIFKRVLAVEPFYAKAYARLGMAGYQSGDYGEARRQYEMAISLNPNDYNSLYNLGELFLTIMNDMNESWKYLQQCVRLKPDHEMALYKLGIIAINNRNYKEALGYLDRAYEQEKNLVENSPPLSVSKSLFIRIQLLRATAWENLGDIAKAYEIISETYRIDPFDPVIKQKMAILKQKTS